MGKKKSYNWGKGERGSKTTNVVCNTAAKGHGVEGGAANLSGKGGKEPAGGGLQATAGLVGRKTFLGGEKSRIRKDGFKTMGHWPWKWN